MEKEKTEWLPAKAWNDSWEEKTGTDALADWLKKAARPVYWPPDRRQVRRELRDHIDERVEGLQNRGLSLGDARRETLKRMGDPAEVGALLRQVHKPWLGWALSLVRIAVVLLLVVGIIGLVGNGLRFRTGGQMMRDVGYGTGTEKYGNNTVTKTVIMERPWHCDEELQYGSFTVRCEDVVFRCVQSETEGYETSCSAGLETAVLLRFTAAPWVRLPDHLYGVTALSITEDGTEYPCYYVDGIDRGSWIRPWAEVRKVSVPSRPDADRLEIRLNYAGEEQTLHVSLDAWEARNLDALPDELRGTTDYVWSRKQLNGYRYLHVEKRFGARSKTSGETLVSVFQAALSQYEKDGTKGYLMDCTMIFRGDTMLLPLSPTWLEERLQIIDCSEGSDGVPVEYTVYKTALCRDLCYCRVVWESTGSAQQFELRYQQDPKEAACVLKLKPEVAEP